MFRIKYTPDLESRKRMVRDGILLDDRPYSYVWSHVDFATREEAEAEIAKQGANRHEYSVIEEPSE